jgi:murein L,D-transpeptidase YcbB/YkuD
MVRTVVPVVGVLAAWISCAAAQPTTFVPPVAPGVELGSAVHGVVVRGLPGGTTAESMEAGILWRALARHYRARNYQAIWCDGWGGFPSAVALFQALREAPARGLDPAAYPVDELEERVALAGFRGPRFWAETDVFLSYTFLTYARHLARGRIDPSTLEIDWHLRPRSLDLVSGLDRAAATGDVVGVLAGFEPDSPAYRALRGMLAEYRALEDVEWPALQGRFLAGVGDTLGQADAVRRLLQYTGDLPPGPARGPVVYDDLLAEGVRRFQLRHGLKADGILGPQTLARMAVPPAQRVETILVNLERWRWMPALPDSKSVLVNIPDYRLYAMGEEGDTVMTMAVITGAVDTPTAVFQDEITYMELNPEWHVPESIASGELVPRIQEDPEYLLAQNFTVYDTSGIAVDPALIDWTAVQGETLAYRFKQASGVLNPLGSIKFMFPNPFSIYLHDTPNGKLFGADMRAFSHGCVRIERPLDFADYLLAEDEAWTGEKVGEAIATGKRKWIHPRAKVPIVITYLTAFEDGAGRPSFRDDVYGVDRVVAEALAAYRPPLGSSASSRDVTAPPPLPKGN